MDVVGRWETGGEPSLEVIVDVVVVKRGAGRYKKKY